MTMSEQQPLLQDAEAGENSNPSPLSFRERLAFWLESQLFHKIVIALVGVSPTSSRRHSDDGYIDHDRCSYRSYRPRVYVAFPELYHRRTGRPSMA